jgi:rSAM/selenodomain-associated transferase 2
LQSLFESCKEMISVIIPTYNEVASVGNLINYLKENSGGASIEIIVSDGGSLDKTCAVAGDAGALVFTSPRKGRAAQMNFGVSKASGDILYFIHADCIPPASFVADITKALEDKFELGRYHTQFMSNSFLLKLNAYFTRFDIFLCYGGDQTFFITRQLFTKLNGFDETKLIMEDYDITERARKMGRYKIMQKPVLVSARKYDNNTWLTVQKANYKAIKMYQQGADSSLIAQAYKNNLKG